MHLPGRPLFDTAGANEIKIKIVHCARRERKRKRAESPRRSRHAFV